MAEGHTVYSAGAFNNNLASKTLITKPQVDMAAHMAWIGKVDAMVNPLQRGNNNRKQDAAGGHLDHANNNIEGNEPRFEETTRRAKKRNEDLLAKLDTVHDIRELGLRWHRVGPLKPESGRELTNENLAAALSTTATLTRD
eukprot:640982-Prymnesium_polylepis.1